MVATTSQSASLRDATGAHYHFNDYSLLGTFRGRELLIAFDVSFSRQVRRRVAGIVAVNPAARGAHPNREAVFPVDGRTYKVYHCTLDEAKRNATVLVGASTDNESSLEVYRFSGYRLTKLTASKAGPYRRLVGKVIPARLEPRNSLTLAGSKYIPQLADVDPIRLRAVYVLQDGITEFDIIRGTWRTLNAPRHPSRTSWYGDRPAWYFNGRLYATKESMKEPPWNFSSEGAHFALLRAGLSRDKWNSLGAYRKLGSSANERFWVYQDKTGGIFVGPTAWFAK
ncbi:MAG: hypothetical protein ACR2HJ_06450 [Fimbriimonadales bacterium]